MLRWLFLVTWILIFFALAAGVVVMVQLSLHLKRDAADREVLAHLLRGLIKTAAPEGLKPPPPDDPPVTMGMDFGLGQVWWWLKPFLFGGRR